MKSTKRLMLILCSIFSLILIIFSSISLSKYIFENDDGLVGSYTSFVLAHNGNGQSTSLQGNNNSYVGYIDLQVRNYTDEKNSVRDVSFKLRIPTEDEINNGYIDDGWGNKINLEQKNLNYEVSIVNLNGDVQANETILKGGVNSSCALILKIEFNGEISDKFEDKLSIIIETTSPYSVKEAFTISVTNSLVSFGINNDTYFGFEEKKVIVKTAGDFSGFDPRFEVFYTKLQFVLSEGILFDESRLKKEYESIEFEKNNNILTIKNIAPGSEISLYFYVISSNYELTCDVLINDESYEYVAGLSKISDTSSYLVFSKGGQ